MKVNTYNPPGLIGLAQVKNVANVALAGAASA